MQKFLKIRWNHLLGYGVSLKFGRGSFEDDYAWFPFKIKTTESELKFWTPQAIDWPDPTSISSKTLFKVGTHEK